MAWVRMVVAWASGDGCSVRRDDVASRSNTPAQNVNNTHRGIHVVQTCPGGGKTAVHVSTTPCDSWKHTCCFHCCLCLPASWVENLHRHTPQPSPGGLQASCLIRLPGAQACVDHPLAPLCNNTRTSACPTNSTGVYRASGWEANSGSQCRATAGCVSGALKISQALA